MGKVYDAPCNELWTGEADPELLISGLDVADGEASCIVGI